MAAGCGAGRLCPARTLSAGFIGHRGRCSSRRRRRALVTGEPGRSRVMAPPRSAGSAREQIVEALVNLNDPDFHSRRNESVRSSTESTGEVEVRRVRLPEIFLPVNQRYHPQSAAPWGGGCSGDTSATVRYRQPRTPYRGERSGFLRLTIVCPVTSPKSPGGRVGDRLRHTTGTPVKLSDPKSDHNFRR